MDFDLTELQILLLNSAEKFLEKEVKNLIREIEKSDSGYSPELWRKMAELGWLGIVFPEKYGGIEGDFTDLVLLVEEMGKALFPGPFGATLISGLAILEYGNEIQKDQFLPDLIAGNSLIASALMLPDPAMGAITMDEKIVIKDDHFIISGTRLFVPFAHVADYLLYSADTDQGPVILLIDNKTPGITTTCMDSIGANKPCEIILEDVVVPISSLLGEMGQGTRIVNKLQSWGALTESAYITGMLEQVVKMTVEYAKEREQFEKKIGTFQAIQHKCSDMITDVDQSKLLTYEAAWKLSHKMPATIDISMAKSWASDASRRVSFMGVMLHGGNGVSEEYDMQLYFRRAKSSEVTFGDGDFHREIIAQELGLQG